MVAYKWVLRAGSKKEICPRCGKRRFVPYVAAKDCTTLAGEEFGRCDREQNCGYFRYPSHIEQPADIVPQPPRPALPMLQFSPDAVQVSTNTALFEYIARLLNIPAAVNIFRRYKIGATHDNRTIYWQIDVSGVVRAGKSIPYGIDGHRIKSDAMPAAWLHRSREYSGKHNSGELKQCFFGEHLLSGNDMPVAIVESEKTAAVMSEIARNHIWLAAGGANGLKNAEKNAVLKGRQVFLMPDNGQYFAWRNIGNTYGWETCDICEQMPVFEGCDILDFVEAGLFDKYIRKHI